MNFNKIQFFKKSGLIAAMLLSGMALISIPQLSWSAAIETEFYTIDISPATPTTSDIVSLRIENRFCTPGSDLKRIDIHHIQHQINISLTIGSSISFTGCLPSTETYIPIGQLNTGTYNISVYHEEPVQGTVNFDMENLLGVLNLTILEPNTTMNPEVPAEGSIQSGVGVIRGWACDATIIEIKFDDEPKVPVAYGTSRKDTNTICGDDNNGYGMVVAWGSLSKGLHQMKTFVDGVEKSTVSFEVSGLAEPFVTGLSGNYDLQDFPAPGQSVTVQWSEAKQNFIIIELAD